MGKFTNWKNVYVKCDCCHRVELVAEGQTDRLIANDWMKENGWSNRKIRDGVWIALCPACNEALYSRQPEKKHNGQQDTCGEEEAKARRESLKTQGRKGCKAPRINMAFTDSNHEFIKTVAKATGQSMTDFLNRVIELYREEHPDILDHAKGFIKFANYKFGEGK